MGVCGFSLYGRDASSICKYNLLISLALSMQIMKDIPCVSYLRLCNQAITIKESLQSAGSKYLILPMKFLENIIYVFKYTWNKLNSDLTH